MDLKSTNGPKHLKIIDVVFLSQFRQILNPCILPTTNFIINKWVHQKLKHILQIINIQIQGVQKLYQQTKTSNCGEVFIHTWSKSPYTGWGNMYYLFCFINNRKNLSTIHCGEIFMWKSRLWKFCYNSWQLSKYSVSQQNIAFFVSINLLNLIQW